MSSTFSSRSFVAAALLCLTICLPTAGRADVRDSVRGLERAAGAGAKGVISPHTGALTFLRTRGGGVPLAAAADAPAAERARAFLRAHGRSLNLPTDDVTVASTIPPDVAGFEQVRLRQHVGGIPVRWGEMTVHLRGNRLTALHARTVTDTDGIELSPTVAAEAAAATAAELVHTKYRRSDASFAAPALELFNRGLAESTAGTTRLAWMIAATGTMLNAQIWIDAHTGDVLFDLNQVPDALNRVIYDREFNNTIPYPGNFVGNEGSPPTSPDDAVNVFAWTADTYYYFLFEHSRDSFDGSGATMQATVRYCDNFCGCPCFNAFWNGAHTVYGVTPFNGDDIVGHEWTHGVTQYSANLIYYKASGALNESYSDIFGETIDLLNGTGYDPPEARWRVSESALAPAGIRHMMTPTVTPGLDPDKMSSNFFLCTENDSGGVHSNSSIGNHAYALMVDGGSFNGFTINGIGFTKAAKVEYRALTQYLTPTSTIQDNYEALLQSCSDLIGIAGITAADCLEVEKAVDSVEMYAPWPCTCGDGNLDPEEECDDGNQVDGDCCSSLCLSSNAGDPCFDGDGCSKDDTCQLVGPNLTCVGIDGPRNSCRGSIDTGTARIAIKDTLPDTKDRLSFSYGKGVETTKSEFGNPLAGTSYFFCLYKQSQSTPIYQTTLPAASSCKDGKPCWKDTRKGFKYTDGLASRGGVSSLNLSEGIAGKAKITLRAKADSIDPPAIGTFNENLTGQVVNSDGLCWDAEFATPPTKLTVDVFKDTGE